jgi:hypothetical protein
MGMLLQTVTNLTAHDRALCYRSSTATHFGAHSMRIVLALTVLFLIAIGAYGLAIDRPLVAVHAAILTVFPLALAAIGIRK